MGRNLINARLQILNDWNKRPAILAIARCGAGSGSSGGNLYRRAWSAILFSVLPEVKANPEYDSPSL